MSTCPFALSLVGTVPASNYSAGPVPKAGAAVHVIVGSAESAVNEFQSPNVQLSATYVIAGPNDKWPDGTLLQLLDNQDVCYAQGNGNWPPDSHNAIEVAGTPDQPMSDPQLTTLRHALMWDSQDCGYPLSTVIVPHGTPGVTAHCNPDGSPDPNWGNHDCPGPIRLAQLAQLLGAITPATDAGGLIQWL